MNKPNDRHWTENGHTTSEPKEHCSYAEWTHPNVKVDWIYCAKCGEYMNIPEFDLKTGKAYHKWCLNQITNERLK
jgi:hypothetical protein